jgi:hypothetical protein
MISRFKKIKNKIRYIFKDYYRWILLILKDPGVIKYFFLWYKLNQSTLISDKIDKIPWITFSAIEWLGDNLKQNMIVFEWGSGGSTFFLSQKVKRIVSVEHNKEWYIKVKNRIKEENIFNCTYVLITPDFPNRNIELDQINYKTKAENLSHLNFESYCKIIDSYDNELFDLIIIDGRARNSCIFHSIAKLRRGGYLLLDNSEREEYSSGIALLDNWQKIDFFGPGPYNKYFWQTSLFIKP